MSRRFQPARLQLARKLRGLRQNQLAQTLEVTPAAVSQYESDAAAPSPDVVERMAVSLKCRPDFFYRPMRVTASRPFFRSLRRTPQWQRDRAESYALLLGEIAQLLDEDVELPAVAVPMDMRLGSDASIDGIEHAALRLRAMWSIPPGPVADVVRLLEVHGVVVAAVGDFDERLDAFSLWASGRPVVILCTAKGVPKRRRFDAAHELGHLVLHEAPRPGDQVQERQAHRFAASLLMPAEEIEPWLPRRSNQLERLQEASETWGVSMQALLFRARTLGVLSESSYVRAMQRMSALGWRADEPVEDGPEETPTLLGASVEALEAGGGNLAELANRLGVPVGRLCRMLAVPEERAARGDAPVVLMERRLAG